jgi:hypothetical protein
MCCNQCGDSTHKFVITVYDIEQLDEPTEVSFNCSNCNHIMAKAHIIKKEPRQKEIKSV